MSEVVVLRTISRFDAPVERTLSNMLFFLATGWYPWGFKPNHDPAISLCDDTWIMCCGNVLKKDEGDAAALSGLFNSGRPDRFGRPTLIIGPKGEAWLEKHWPESPFDTGREE